VLILNKPISSKLFKLKEWLTLPDAAKHLTGVCGEEVTEADILRLALDGHLKLSVNFINSAHALPAQVVKLGTALVDGVYPVGPLSIRKH
jgi:hypothetical protein